MERGTQGEKLSASALQERLGKLLRQHPEVSPSQCDDLVRGSGAVSAEMRISLYQRQYWLRLIEALEQSFPLVLALYGRKRFHDEWAIPYLMEHPPTHYGLHRIGERFAPFCNEEAAYLDWACQVAFWEVGHPHLQELNKKKLYLQPYVTLLTIDTALLPMREAALNGKTLPTLSTKKIDIMVFRNRQNQVECATLTKEQRVLLDLFSRGASLEEAAESVAYLEGVWFQEWVLQQLFYQS